MELLTGRLGTYVPLSATILGCRKLFDGEYDGVPEERFYMIGTIEEALQEGE